MLLKICAVMAAHAIAHAAAWTVAYTEYPQATGEQEIYVRGTVRSTKDVVVDVAVVFDRPPGQSAECLVCAFVGPGFGASCSLSAISG